MAGWSYGSWQAGRVGWAGLQAVFSWSPVWYVAFHLHVCSMGQFGKSIWFPQIVSLLMNWHFPSELIVFCGKISKCRYLPRAVALVSLVWFKWDCTWEKLYVAVCRIVTRIAKDDPFPRKDWHYLLKPFFEVYFSCYCKLHCNPNLLLLKRKQWKIFPWEAVEAVTSPVWGKAQSLT